MSENNNSNAIDKLDEINNKIGAIVSLFSCIDVDICIFNDADVEGFNVILRDLQGNIKEVKELLS